MPHPEDSPPGILALKCTKRLENDIRRDARCPLLPGFSHGEERVSWAREIRVGCVWARASVKIRTKRVPCILCHSALAQKRQHARAHLLLVHQQAEALSGAEMQQRTRAEAVGRLRRREHEAVATQPPVTRAERRAHGWVELRGGREAGASQRAVGVGRGAVRVGWMPIERGGACSKLCAVSGSSRRRWEAKSNCLAIRANRRLHGISGPTQLLFAG
jgi:hypothetical protein